MIRRSKPGASLFFMFSVLAALTFLVFASQFINASHNEKPAYSQTTPPETTASPPAAQTDPSSAHPDLTAELDRAFLKIKELEDKIEDMNDFSAIRKRVDALSHVMAPLGIKLVKPSGAGNVALSGTILFKGDRYELATDAMEFLDRVFPAIVHVLLAPDNIAAVKEIHIVGHSNPVGDILPGYELSQRRALSVVKYLLGSGNKALTAEQKTALSGLLTAVGLSENHPVYRADGMVDDVASRRVEISVTFVDGCTDRAFPELLNGE